MKQCLLHPWDLSEEAARSLQTQMAARVERADRFGPVRYVAGVDVAYDKDGSQLVAAAVVLDADSLEIVESACARDIERFPYIPGLFSFRELAPLALALEKLTVAPDLIVCDGQGIAHPRRFGLACHLGLLFDVPTIGCGKSRLVGEHGEPEAQRGARAALVCDGEVVGSVLRTQDNTKPLYVSTGHRISLDSACDWIVRLAPTWRQPETTRAADHAVKLALKDAQTNPGVRSANRTQAQH